MSPRSTNFLSFRCLTAVAIAVLACTAVPQPVTPGPSEEPGFSPSANESTERAQNELDAALGRLWDGCRELERLGLLSYRRVVLFPALYATKSGRRATASSEILVDRIRRAAPQGVEVVYGAGLQTALEENFLSTSQYLGDADARALARDLPCDFVISGQFEFQNSRKGRTMELTLCGAVPWSLGNVYDETISIPYANPIFDPVNTNADRPPRVPFGADPNCRDVAFGDAERGAHYSSKLERLVRLLESTLAQDASSGRVLLPEGLQTSGLVLLPPTSFAGSTSGLSDALESALRRRCGTVRLARDLDVAMREKGECLAWYAADPDPASLARFDVPGAIRTRYRFDESTRELEVEFTCYDSRGGTSTTRSTMSTARVQELVRKQSAEPCQVTLAALPIDGETLLQDSVRGQIDALIAENANVIKGKSIRVLPVVTPATRNVYESFHQIRQELVNARLEIEKRAAKDGVTLEDALASERYPVRLTSQRCEYPSWRTAEALLFAFEWQQLMRSDAFAQGRMLVRGLESRFAQVEAKLQTNDELLGVLEAGLRTPSDIATVSKYDELLGKETTRKVLAEISTRRRLVPELALVVEVDCIGAGVVGRVAVRASLISERDSTSIGKPVEDGVLVGPRAAAVSANVAGASAIAIPAVAPRATSVRILYDGRAAKTVADALKEFLVGQGEQYVVSSTTGFTSWNELTPSLSSPIELRFPASLQVQAQALGALVHNSAARFDGAVRSHLKRFEFTLIPDSSSATSSNTLTIYVRL